MIGNRLSVFARQKYARAELPSWEDPGWSIALVSAGYVFDEADEFLDAIDPGDLLGTAALSGTAVLADGACDADDAVIPASDGETWAGYWLFFDTGDAATSPLVGWFDTDPALGPIEGVVSGGEATIEFQAAGLFRL